MDVHLVSGLQHACSLIIAALSRRKRKLIPPVGGNGSNAIGAGAYEWLSSTGSPSASGDGDLTDA